MAIGSRHRVVIAGGGFGGVFTAKHLRKQAGGDVEIELISRNNFFVFQPLLPEVAGGSIHPADAVSPLRLFLPDVSVRIAEIRRFDFPAKTVHVADGRDGEITAVPYDQLVIALGQVVDLSRTPGLAERAFVMKDVIDAFKIRNQVMGCLEEADSTPDPRRKRSLLTFVVIGGGFTGVETIGEVQDLIGKSLRHYPCIRPDEIAVVLVQHGARILPELPEHLAVYAEEQLRRRGIRILLKTGVRAVTADGVVTDGGETIDAETIIAAIGNAPSPLMHPFPVPLDHGRIVVDRAMQVKGLEHVWALGDNAHIPLGDPGDDKTAYAPPLAQFAFREARVLAGNILARIEGRPLKAFRYESLGTMASLGDRRGVAEIMGRRITGFLAWAAWRFFYLTLLPGVSTRVRVAVDWLLDLVISRSIVEFRPARSVSRPMRFLSGDVVVEPEAAPSGIYIVVSGCFESTPAGVGGDEAPGATRRLGPGDFFGTSPDGSPPAEPATIRACESSTVYFIDRGDLKPLAMVAALIEKSGPAIVREEPESV